MKAAIVLLKSDGSQIEIPVKGDRLLVGRSPECSLRIPRDSVSRRHCELVVEDDEVLLLRDLASANGTYVNARRTDQQELSPGDVLSIGGALFVVRLDGAPAKIDAQAAIARGTPAPTGTRSSEMQPGGAPRPAKAAPPKPLTQLSPDPDDSSLFDFDLDDDKDAPKL